MGIFKVRFNYIISLRYPTSSRALFFIFLKHIVGQSSRTESSNQLDATEENDFDAPQQHDFSKPFVSSSETRLRNQYSTNGNQSSSEECSSASSSEEEEEAHVNLKKSHDSHEPIFVKVPNSNTIGWKSKKLYTSST